MAAAARGELGASHACAEREAAEAQAQAVGGVASALEVFQQESDAVEAVEVPARAPQSFEEVVSRTAPEEALRAHFDEKGDAPYEGALTVEVGDDAEGGGDKPPLSAPAERRASRGGEGMLQRETRTRSPTPSAAREAEAIRVAHGRAVPH